MKKIIYTRPDGGVNIICPAPKSHLEKMFGKLSKSQYEKHVRERSIPADAINVRSIDEKDIPKNRSLRDAWADNKPGTQIDIDMNVARNVHMNKIRRARDERLEELDKRKYDDSFEVERQKLRDLPQTFDLTKANTPEAINALWPTELK